jgi:hypothetical protein
MVLTLRSAPHPPAPSPPTPAGRCARWVVTVLFALAAILLTSTTVRLSIPTCVPQPSHRLGARRRHDDCRQMGLATRLVPHLAEACLDSSSTHVLG